MWGYLVLGVIIGMLVLMFIYCIWSFVDDCKTTSDLAERLLYRTDNLRADITSLWTSVHILERELPIEKRGVYDAHSGTDASGYSDAVPEQPDVAEEGSEHA